MCRKPSINLERQHTCQSPNTPANLTTESGAFSEEGASRG